MADRILEQTRAVALRDTESQLLDNMDLERERGITIKTHVVTLVYHVQDEQDYIFSLIDTPRHVDFNYEVPRPLAACEGVLLVVGASQGIEAQTLVNTYLALGAGLEIVPVINKIDLPNADPNRVKVKIEDVIGLPTEDAPCISAKAGSSINQVMERVAKDIPPSEGDETALLQTLIFDPYCDSHRSVIVYVHVKHGTVRAGDQIRMMASDSEFTIVEVGYPRATGMESTGSLYAGEIGYTSAPIKAVRETRVGDIVTLASCPAKEPFPGYCAAQPMVFCGAYPADGAYYSDLREVLEHLQLSDAAPSSELETSIALGFGFRCGFLGLLHMEIVQERLKREYDFDLVTAVSGVVYRITKTDGEMVYVDNPTNYPDPTLISMAEELMTNTHIYSPSEYVGNITELCQERRDVFQGMRYLDTDRVDIHYTLPLNEIIYDFFDAPKSHTRGYVSPDYELIGYEKSNLVKLDILLNGEMVDVLSFIIHADEVYPRACKTTEKLAEKIPRQFLEVSIQARIGGRIIACEIVRAMSKDTLAKCYGGDTTRKKKLLEEQKEGKKRMRQFGAVEVPQDAFISVLKLDEQTNIPNGGVTSHTPIGLYLHVPFYKAKCPYYDLYSIRGKEEEKDAYTEQMKCLLYVTTTRLNHEADTVYFGGGTPSVLGADQIVGLLGAVRQNWGPSGAEITVEVSPGEYELGFLETLRKAGVNRLSMGLQSADEEELRLLGRYHSIDQVRQAVREAQQAGLDNTSLDLMLAVQQQNSESLQRSIAFCADCGMQHVSSYLLRIEQGMVYYDRRDDMVLPDENESAKLYLLVCRELGQAGFHRYEVSNSVVPGYESRYNLKYWNAEKYYGAGLSAHSFIDGRRYYYPGDLEAFLQEPRNICEGDGGSSEEYAMLQLRLRGGLQQKEYQSRFGSPFPEEYLERVHRYVEQGLVVCDEENICFAPKGFLVPNTLTVDILLG